MSSSSRYGARGPVGLVFHLFSFLYESIYASVSSISLLSFRMWLTVLAVFMFMVSVYKSCISQSMLIFFLMAGHMKLITWLSTWVEHSGHVTLSLPARKFSPKGAILVQYSASKADSFQQVNSLFFKTLVPRLLIYVHKGYVMRKIACSSCLDSIFAKLWTPGSWRTLLLDLT